MTANELRIGNYVWNEVQNIPVIVDLKIINDQFYADKGLKKGWHAIPLSEEWLVKLGFADKQGSGCYELNIFRIGLSGLDFVNGAYTVLMLKNNIFLKKVQYVHEIQNLYFELIGEELKLKY